MTACILEFLCALAAETGEDSRVMGAGTINQFTVLLADRLESGFVKVPERPDVTWRLHSFEMLAQFRVELVRAMADSGAVGSIEIRGMDQPGSSRLLSRSGTGDSALFTVVQSEAEAVAKGD